MIGKVWKGALCVLIVGCAIWLMKEQLTLAQELCGKTEQVKHELEKQALSFAALTGERVKMPKGNDACLVCHSNFAEEELAITHLKQGLTCAHCHGLSYEHRDDEANVTPPDFLFGRAQVKALCERCHSTHRNPKKVQEFQEKWEWKLRPIGRHLPRNSICTDCHGNHALKPIHILTPKAQKEAGR